MSKRYGGKLAAVEKHFARVWAYMLLKRMGYLYNKYHIVIASTECGDIYLLLSLGLYGKIIVCDKDPAARAAASKIAGVIMSPFDDVVQTTRWAIDSNLDIGSVNVDLCCSVIYGVGPVLKPILDMVKCPVIYTYCRREGKDGPKILGYTIPAMPAEVQKLRVKYIRKLTGRKPVATQPYKSDTSDKDGSNMLVCLFDAPDKKPGKKVQRKQ